MILLFAAFGICWLNDRRRRRKGALDDWDDNLDDDAASALTASPEAVEAPEPIEAPSLDPTNESSSDPR